MHRMRTRGRFYLAALLLSVLACGKEEGPLVPEPEAPTGISFSPELVVVAQAGGEYQLTVTAPSRPRISGEPDWITVRDGTYKDYSITYILKVDANVAGERTASLSVTAGTLTKAVVVSQEGFSIPEVDKTRISAVPVNPKAGDPARKLYSFLLDSYGKKTLSGVQSAHSHTNDYVDAVAAATGKHPALAGYDFIFLQFSPTPPGWSWVRDYTDISAQKEHWNAGGVISYMWHWNVPKDEESYRSHNTDNYDFYLDRTPFDIREAVKEGTWQHEFILEDIDKMAETLKLLQAEGIPVLFRPLHEAAGNYTRYNPNGGAWFWWGRYGAEPCKQLWNLLQDRLQGYHGLDNLLWVWTMDVMEGYEREAAQWYPGDDRVDIIGFDVYAENTAAKPAQFAFLQEVTGGRKILTISECGNVPSPEANFAAGAPFSWFMVWNTTFENDAIDLQGFPLNTMDYWKSLMNSDLVYTRENMPLLK